MLQPGLKQTQRVASQELVKEQKRLAVFLSVVTA